MINLLISQQKALKPSIIKNPEDVEVIVIDLFCGAGGTTTGYSKAKNALNNQIAIIAACVNHDHKAITSHWKNHPEVYHFEEDITKLYGMVKHDVFFMSPEIVRLRKLIGIYRALYPKAKVVLWASLECTNFSKAKGGQPRDQDSRTLANHLDRYIHAIEPDYVKIENVVEFMAWGPMRVVCKKRHKEDLSKGIFASSELKYILNKKTNKQELAFAPISKKNGQDFRKWENHINSLGYRSSWRELNSADFGAYTSRNRLFGCFAKPGLPVYWPEATHAKKPESDGLFGNGLKKWKPVRDLLDFEDEGKSIFNRKKPLVENTLKRIYAGLIKEVAGGEKAFLAQYNSGKDRITSINDPCNTIPTANRFGLVQTSFIMKYFSGRPMNKITSIDDPLATIKTRDGNAIVNVQPFIMTSSFKGISRSIDEPAPTILASRKHHYVVNPSFLMKYYLRNEKGSESVDNPLGTITTKDRFSLIRANWLDKQYSGCHNHQSVDQPAGTIMTSDKHALMTAKGFIYNPSHGGHTMHIDQPCPVIIARQDKAPLYFIQYNIDPSVRIEIYDGDCETMVKIKEFMTIYGLSDVMMRMLKVSELKVIQGFPEDYVLVGNQSDQKKFIGNSVVPKVVQKWAEAMAIQLN